MEPCHQMGTKKLLDFRFGTSFPAPTLDSPPNSTDQKSLLTEGDVKLDKTYVHTETFDTLTRAASWLLE